MPILSPKVDQRKVSDLVRQLKRILPHYAPELISPSDGMANALVQIAAYLSENTINRLNQVPKKNLVAFLSMLGIERIPAVPARVPATFNLAKGTENGIRIPIRMRLNASSEEFGDLPFETLTDLLATPSTLMAVIAVDPKKDAIYKPPNGFVETQTQLLTDETVYHTVSLASGDSRNFQLDTVDNLESGNYLRIGDDVLYEDIEIESISGNIVVITDTLQRDYVTNTNVEKTTSFRLFESINIQEHHLYLGHADLFSIKTEARLDIGIIRFTDSVANQPGLDQLVWEYWGEATGIEGEGWQKFRIDTDTTQGMKFNGRVVLLKPEGEIKELDLNGLTNRWIRGRLDYISQEMAPQLPALDEISFRVASAGEPQPPDQAFHNDTPLDVNLEFHPFGTEPKTFDRFYMASKEAFSKKGANVSLNISLQLSDTFDTPSVIQIGNTTRVFSRAPHGKLSELLIEYDENLVRQSKFIDHEKMSDSTIALNTSVATVAVEVGIDTLFHTFVISSDGRIYDAFKRNTEKATWKENKKPTGLDNLILSPTAVLLNGVPEVFAVGIDGQLYSMPVEPTNGENKLLEWTNYGKPDKSKIVSTPTVLNKNPNSREFTVLVTAEDGYVYKKIEGGAWTILDNDVEADVHAQPFLVDYKIADDSVEWVYVRSKNNKLMRYFNRDPLANPPPNPPVDPPIWSEIDFPSKDVIVSSDPSVLYVPEYNQIWVTVRGSDNRLWLWEEHIDDIKNSRWVALYTTDDVDLRASPVAGKYAFSDKMAEPVILIHSATTNNSIVQLQHTLRINHGTAIGGARDTISLAKNTTGGSHDFVSNSIYLMPALGEKDTGEHKEYYKLRTVSAYNNESQVASILKSRFGPWEIDPSGERYRLVKIEEINGKELQSIINVENNGKLLTLEYSPDIKKEYLINIEFNSNAGSDTDIVSNILQINEVSHVKPGASAQMPGSTTLEVSGNWTTTPKKDEFCKILSIKKDHDDKNIEGVARNSNNNILITPPDINGPSINYTGLKISLYDDIGENIGSAFMVNLDCSTGSRPPKSTCILVLTNSILENVEKNQIIQYQISQFDLQNSWSQFKSIDISNTQPGLSWEYWNGRGWSGLRNLEDNTNRFLNNGAVLFPVPNDIEATEVAGQENLWIRVRIIDGDYGVTQYKTVTTPAGDGQKETQVLVTDKSAIQPPLITIITVSYNLKEDEYPQTCLTFNNLDYVDQTAACSRSGKRFAPFVPLLDKTKTVHLGFDKKLMNGPITLFFIAHELEYSEREKPKIAWNYYDGNAWLQMSTEDETEGLIKQGLLKINLPLDFTQHTQFGNSYYWIRGSKEDGIYGRDPSAEQTPILDGILPNTVWAHQAETVINEILGSSNGEANQILSFIKAPILAGQQLRIREFLSQEEQTALRERYGTDIIVEEKDIKGNVIATWVLWEQVTGFFDSGPTDRHYKTDRVQGQIQFGNGINAAIPATGKDNIVAFEYETGGGKKGNIKPGEVNTLKTAIAGVTGVTNRVAAGGGSDAVSLDDMLEIGPSKLSHRRRAVTVSDFEWLAKDASREVVKVRCIANRNNLKQTQKGWVTLIIVPDNDSARPYPSFALRTIVEKYLKSVCANNIATVNHVFVQGPEYVEISVNVDIFAKSLDDVAQVEETARKTLNRYFHPLIGGADGNGWDFGRHVVLSDIYALLENIVGVDHLKNLQLQYSDTTSTLYATQLAIVKADPYANPQECEESSGSIGNAENAESTAIIIPQDTLVANGRHNLNMLVAAEGI